MEPSTGAHDVRMAVDDSLSKAEKSIVSRSPTASEDMPEYLRARKMVVPTVPRPPGACTSRIVNVQCEGRLNREQLETLFTEAGLAPLKVTVGNGRGNPPLVQLNENSPLPLSGT